MDYNYYKISDAYKKIILKEYMGISNVQNDIKNSYQTTASMQGVGNGPVAGSQSGLSQGGNNVMFPDKQEISNEAKKKMLISFLKDEIDNGTFDEVTKKKFVKLLSHLISSDYNK